jgi:hypothetical protein
MAVPTPSMPTTTAILSTFIVLSPLGPEQRIDEDLRASQPCDAGAIVARYVRDDLNRAGQKSNRFPS